MQEPLFSSLIESTKSYEMLCRDIVQNTLSHAYIFCSPDRLALDILISLFAARIVGGEDEEKELVYQNKHADVIRIPQSDGGKARTTVLSKDIDFINQNVHLRPVYGNKKVYIIDYAETMNATCQNKLLKILEEPPATVHFILSSASDSALLQTIVSRCKQAPPPFFENGIKGALKKAYPASENIDLAVSYCGNDLTKATSWITDKKYSQVFSTALSSLLGLNSSKNILFSSAQMNNYKDSLALILELYELIFRDVLMMHQSLFELISLKSHIKELQTLSKMFSSDACLNIMTKIVNANKRLKLNANLQSVIDELLFSIAESKAKYK